MARRQRMAGMMCPLALALSVGVAACTIEDRGAARSDYDQWFSSKYGPTADAPYGEYEAEPELRLTTNKSGETVTVARRWITARTPVQACADFRKGIEEVGAEVAEEDTGIRSICVLSAEHGRVTVVVTNGQASGAEIVILERKP